MYRSDVGRGATADERDGWLRSLVVMVCSCLRVLLIESIETLNVVEHRRAHVRLPRAANRRGEAHWLCGCTFCADHFFGGLNMAFWSIWPGRGASGALIEIDLVAERSL